MCPACGGSIQMRYQSAGCLTSAPKLLVWGLFVWGALELVAAR
jgi:hypothetical protein